MKDHDEEKMVSNMERVLRAMDVIPPFGGPVSPERVQSIASANAQPDPPEDKSVEENLDKGVPMLDLGEKILAEQRRVTAGKRKGPGGGKPAVKPQFETPPAAPRISPYETATEDLAELQLIVADIVARDIERLCTGPQRSFR